MKAHLLLPLFFLLVFSCTESNWTHFRGSNLDGKALNQKPPIAFSTDSNVVWQTEIPGTGWSSPVIYENQVWLSTSMNAGKGLYALAIDRKDGSIIHEKLLFTPDSIFGKHAVNSYATPTPCIEKDFVYVNFGRYGTACLSTQTAEVIWQRTDLQCNHVQGPGSSPLLYEDLLILHYEGIDEMYIVAMDKQTGETRWKTNRPGELYLEMDAIGKKAYITPIVITVEGRDLLISNGSAVCIAYDVKTGEEVWRVRQGEDSTISSPFYEQGMVYFYTGFVTGSKDEKYAELFAVDPRGKGDITNSHIVWRLKSPILQLLTPVINQGLIYTIDTKSDLTCIDASTGEVYYQEKMSGKYNASPVLANGHLYFPSSNGTVLVVKEGKKLAIAATNKLQGQIWASPAVANHKLYIRSNKFLYCIGNK